MASITFQYRSTKNKAPLEARLTYKLDGKHTSLYARSEIIVEKAFWKEYRKGINFRDADKINLKKEIDEKCNKLESYIMDHFEKIFSLDSSGITKKWLMEVVNVYYNPRVCDGAEIIPTSLVGYWDFYLRKQKKAKILSHRRWITVKNKVIKLQESTGKIYDVKDVDENFMNEFIEYSQKENYSDYTIKREFSFIKSVCRHARLKKIKVFSELDLLHVKLDESVRKPDKIYLSFDELDVIAALQGLPEPLDNVRDWLVISCYTGQRISDFMRFDKSMIREDKGELFLGITQKKTGNKVDIPLLNEVVQILDKRGGEFPRAISHPRYNEYVKEVCRRAGLTEMTYGGIRMNNRVVIGRYPKYQLITGHTSRRSFATNYYGKLPTSYLKDVTGHKTEAQLLVYLNKSDPDKAHETLDKMRKARNQ